MRLLLAAITAAALALPTVATAQPKPAKPAAPSQPNPPAKPAAPSQPRPPAKPAATRGPTPRDEGVRVRGFANVGSIIFKADDSFDTILGTHTGVIYGGGAQVLLPWNVFVQVGASQFRGEGERVFIGPNREVFRLGIPVEVTVTPIEVTGGWRYRHCPRPARGPVRPCNPRVVPYGGGGYSLYQYRETSEFAEPSENVDERFNGWHLLGGVDYRLMRWLRVGGEATWTSVPDALGAGGVSAAFNETDLGGTTLRFKITVGR